MSDRYGNRTNITASGSTQVAATKLPSSYQLAMNMVVPSAKCQRANKNDPFRANKIDPPLVKKEKRNKEKRIRLS